jgi:predicted metal-dependent hydrolase
MRPSRSVPEQSLFELNTDPDPSADISRPDDPEVEVRTSSRRRKSASAYWQGDRIVVVLPMSMPLRDRPAMVERLVRRVLEHRPNMASSDDTLLEHCARLGDLYLGGIRPKSIKWVTNQEKRWGSCTPSTGEIRVSHRLRAVPDWVLDGILLHEMAHLLEAGHTPRFYSLVAQYPKMNEVDTFLAGFGLGLGIAQGNG